MMILAAMMASAQVMPWIDRGWLDEQSRIEAVKPASITATARKAALPAREALSRDVEAISTVCGAASKSADPAAFLTSIGTAFSMPSREVSALRERCALYLIGKRDARHARAQR